MSIRTKKMTKRHCIGCGNDFYNGKNDLGINECWGFNDAVLIKRVSIGHWENPPYKDKIVIIKPNCYHERGNNKNHYVNPDRIDINGYLR